MGPPPSQEGTENDPAGGSDHNQVASFPIRPWQGRGGQEPVTGSTFIRSSIPASAGAATQSRLLRVLPLEGRDPSLQVAFSSPVGVRSHIRPAFPAVASPREFETLETAPVALMGYGALAWPTTSRRSFGPIGC
jgi:hypothetical protein